MNVNCKFCGGKTTIVFPNGLECIDCKTVQVRSLPSDEEIHEYYKLFNTNYTGGGPSENQIR